MSSSRALARRQDGQLERVRSKSPQSSYTASQATYASRGRRANLDYSYYDSAGGSSGEETSISEHDENVRDARAEVAATKARWERKKVELRNADQAVTKLKSRLSNPRQAEYHSQAYSAALGTRETASEAVEDLKRDLEYAKAHLRQAKAERQRASAAPPARSPSPPERRDSRDYSPPAQQQRIRYASPRKLYGAGGRSTRQSPPQSSYEGARSRTSEERQAPLQLPYRDLSQTQPSLYAQSDHGSMRAPSSRSNAGRNAAASAGGYGSDRSTTPTQDGVPRRSKGKAPVRQNSANSQATLEATSTEAYNVSWGAIRVYSDSRLADVAEAVFKKYYKDFHGHTYKNSLHWGQVCDLVQHYNTLARDRRADKDVKKLARQEAIRELRQASSDSAFAVLVASLTSPTAFTAQTFAASEDYTTSGGATRYGIACAIRRLLDSLE